MRFDGTLQPDDPERLRKQSYAVWACMFDGIWRTLKQIQQEIRHKLYAPTQSISARLRDFRKKKFGGHTVNRRYLGGGVWEYQLIVNRG